MESNSIEDVNDLKRFFVGLFFGIGLAFTLSAQAEEIKNLIGAKIEGQFPVKVNGELIEYPGIVIGGVSYLPTRSIAEIAGFEISFDAEHGIHLQKAKDPDNILSSEIGVKQLSQLDKNNIEERIKGISASIEMMQVSLRMVEDWLSKTDDETKKQQFSSQIEQHIQKIKELEAEKDALEEQLETGESGEN